MIEVQIGLLLESRQTKFYFFPRLFPFLRRDLEI